MSKPLCYVVAVSGGIDSVCLLHMLVRKDARITHEIPETADYIVAHVNHGIRVNESDRDEEFVKALADSYGLRFISTNLNLGPSVSEEVSREARYNFLESMVQKFDAQGIILAHHKQDVLETAIINTIRGSGRRGMTSLRSSSQRVRPLLNLSKKDIYEYALKNGLSWVEDSTNQDPKYLRNRIRLAIKDTDIGAHERAIEKLSEISKKNYLLNKEIATLLQYKFRHTAILSRNWFVKIPHIVACELVHALLAKIEVVNIDRELVERVVVACKVARPGTSIDIDRDTKALVTKRSVRFIDRTTLKARRL